MLNGYIVDKTNNNRVVIGDRMIIGRGVDADLCIDDRVASRSHVEIVRDKLGYNWRDLGSRNGTLLNGVREKSGKLRDGDHIRIGETDMVFELEVAGRRVERLLTPPPFEMAVCEAASADALDAELKKTCSLLDIVYKVIGEIAVNYDICRLQDQILQAAMPAIKAQRGAIFLTNELMQITRCPRCGFIHSYVDGRLTHAEREGLAVSNTVLERVLSKGKGVFFQDSGSDASLQAAESIMSLSLRSIVCVPLRAKSRILGMLYVDTNRPGQHYGQEDLLLATAVGNSAGIALENVFMHQELIEKQRTEQEVETAWAVQESFLRRDWDMGDERFDVFGEATPAKNMGGDFYDVVHIGADTLGLAIGDVSGKGVTAALTMAQVVCDFRQFVKEHASPADTLKKLNEVMMRRSKNGNFCTMICARFDLKTGTLVWSSAGHPPGLFVTEDANEFGEKASGPPLGVVEDASWTDIARVIEPGALALFFTDGIIKARPPSDEPEEFGMARLWTIPEPGASPVLTIEDVNGALKNHLHDAEARDDYAMLALRYMGHLP